MKTCQIETFSRFLTLISHFVLTLTVLMGREENVLACLPLDHTELDLTRKDTELAAGLGVTIALLGIEMIGFMSGLTMFSPLQSLLSIGTHATATIALAYLLLDIWDCDLFWWIFSVCSCFPAVVELTIIVGVLGLKKHV